MEEHLQQIRAAFEASASAEARQAGVLACRALLNVLEAAPVHPESANVELANVVLANVEITAAPAGDAMAPAAEVAPISEALPELCDPREVPPAAATSPVQSAAPPLPPSPPPASAAVPAASGDYVVTVALASEPDRIVARRAVRVAEPAAS